MQQDDADFVADTKDGGPRVVRLCDACRNPARPLADGGHGNQRFHPDCYQDWRRERNAQYKRNQRRRRSGLGTFSGELVTVPAVHLPGRTVLELCSVVTRLHDDARKTASEFEELELSDKDAATVWRLMFDLVDGISYLQDWVMDQLPAPVRRNC